MSETCKHWYQYSFDDKTMGEIQSNLTFDGLSVGGSNVGSNVGVSDSIGASVGSNVGW